MSSESKTGVISNDSRLANEIYANMKNAAKDFSMQKFKGYITSSNVASDEECNESYSGGIEATEKVAEEMKRTARFLKNIGDALIEIDCTAAKDNAK
jgi:hypothetical protein